MGIFSRKPNPAKDVKKSVAPSIKIEVFKGELNKEAFTDTAKKIFSSNDSVAEVILLGDFCKLEDNLIALVKKYLPVEIEVSEEFVNCSILSVDKAGAITQVLIVITEAIESNLIKILEDNKQIVRVTK